MFIKKLQLTNFKRFTNLTIDLGDHADPPQLVLLVGANGSGKSCIFDAFEAISSLSKGSNVLTTYYEKLPGKPYQVTIELGNGQRLNRGNGQESLSTNNPTTFYGRSSLRQVPALTRITFGQQGGGMMNLEKDSDRPKRYIDPDKRFENDLEKIMGQVLTEVYRSADQTQTVSQLKAKYLNPLNEALTRIFGEDNGTKLTLLELIPPLEETVAKVTFKKGLSEIHYDYLGNGEKEVFNILVNWLVRSPIYQDTIYYLDELDLHLNTRLQYGLLKEIVEHWLPPGCQLWTASHSLGFIDYANDLAQAVIIDLDNLDFDQPQQLSASPKRQYEVFEIAVPQEFLAKVVAGHRIIFAENTDTPIYNSLGIEHVIFFTAVDKKDVFHKVKNYSHYWGLIDRDFLTDEEIQTIREKYPSLLILGYYSIENYLYHPANLAEHFQTQSQSFDQNGYIDQLRRCKEIHQTRIALAIKGARDGYPFFQEHEHAKLKKQFRDNAEAILTVLESQEVETFYKVFPAKDYCRDLAGRQNLSKQQLSRTNWFKQQISNRVRQPA